MAVWVRVSQRGRWHRVTGLRPTGAYDTSCGRVLRHVMSRIEAGAPDESRQCEKCRA